MCYLVYIHTRRSAETPLISLQLSRCSGCRQRQAVNRMFLLQVSLQEPDCSYYTIDALQHLNVTRPAPG